MRLRNMLKICLVFWKSEPQYAYKRYAYKKQTCKCTLDAYSAVRFPYYCMFCKSQLTRTKVRGSNIYECTNNFSLPGSHEKFKKAEQLHNDAQIMSAMEKVNYIKVTTSKNMTAASESTSGFCINWETVKG